MSPAGSPMVTIAIPTLRRPAYLAQAIQSALAQDYTNLEVLVSDNGSGDETGEVVGGFSDARLRFRQNRETADAAIHWNQCLNEARGQYFVLLSDDDSVTSNFVSALVRCFESHPSATVGFSSCEVIDETGRVVRQLPVASWELYDGTQFVLDWVWARFPCPPMTAVSMFFRTEAARRAGGFLITPRGLHGDNALLIRLALEGDIVFAQDATLRYRVYNSSWGLSAPYKDLARSSAILLRYLDKEVRRKGQRLLTERQQAQLLRGAARMAAKTYLGRVSSIYLRQMTLRQFLNAVFATYPIDAAYVKALPRFFLACVKRKVQRWTGQGQ